MEHLRVIKEEEVSQENKVAEIKEAFIQEMRDIAKLDITDMTMVCFFLLCQTVEHLQESPSEPPEIDVHSLISFWSLLTTIRNFDKTMQGYENEPT